MTDADKIKKEIIDSIDIVDKTIISKIEEELIIIENSDGLNDKNNLKTFYDIWKRHKDHHSGDDNKINSWTAYALGMTSQKPEGDFLPTRRAFARAGFPDIDADFDDERRDEVYQYLIERWGRDCVGNIGTYMTLKMKAAITRVAKAVDAADAFYRGPKECKARNHELAQEISKTLPVAPTGVIKWKDDEGNDVVIKTISQANQYMPEFSHYMEKYPDILEHSERLEGLVSNNSIHAAGVVISDVPLCQIAPLRSSKKGLATQWAYEDLEAIGLIKFDILSIATLTVIKECLLLIEQNYGIDIDIEKLPLEDSATLDLYSSGHLKGVFQCENSGMQETMREIGVDSFRDVMAAIALYRPGPMDQIPEYVARKRGQNKVDYFHESLEPFVKPYLEQTYGILVYQEQVMQIVGSLAGFSVTDGYVMIKAIGKKKEYLMKRFESQFIDGCVENNIPKSVAEQYWKQFITPFASYGFNASILKSTLIPTASGNKRIEDFKGGEQVYAIDENGDVIKTNVVNLHDHGDIEAFEVVFEDGGSVVCSANHKFLTEEGQLPLHLICKRQLQVLTAQLPIDNHATEEVNIKMRNDFSFNNSNEESSTGLQRMPFSCLEDQTVGFANNANCSMWRGVQQIQRSRRASEKLSCLQKDQKSKYSVENESIESRQSFATKKSNIFSNSKKNICEARYTGSSCEGSKELETRESRKIPADSSGWMEKSETLSNGDMVSITDTLGKFSYTLWGQTKTSRFCQWREDYLDRSRWLLSFLSETNRQGETQTNSSFSDTGKRRDAKSRSTEKKENNASSFINGMLRFINWQDEPGLGRYFSEHAPISNTRNLVPRKIVRVMPLGKKRMYDLEVACSTHNFLLNNGVVTSNSHSCCYGYLSYQTAYLKANYPDEFACAFLNSFTRRAIFKGASAWDQVVMMEREIKRPPFNIKLLPRDLKNCDVEYKIVKKKDPATGVSQTEIRPPVCCKGLGWEAANNIAKNRPYSNLKELAEKTDTKSVTTEAIDALIEAGLLGSPAKKNKAEVVKKFSMIRDDLKKSRSKGIKSVDMFS